MGVSRALALLAAAALSVLRARALDISQCIAPLGMESGLIPDADISASSCYNDGNVAPQNGRLNQDMKGGAWCPRSQISAESVEWLQVDLHGVHVLTAVGTQGRFGNGQGQEFAEAIQLEYWRPRLGKWVRYRTLLGQEILAGNTNTYLEVKTQLKPAVWASRVRFLPHSTHRRTVCMRVELYGCLWNAGIVSYSMPAGDARSNGVELSDATYDGAWSGGELRGGLGQLVDGEFGGDEIREAARVSPWVGWRNDTPAPAPAPAAAAAAAAAAPAPRPRPPPAITFEFDRVREFSAVHIYCNNKFMRDVQVFSGAVVRFSVGGKHYQEEPVRFSHAPDNIFESARNVTIKLHHRIARWVRLELHFAARWILLSEVVFDAGVAQGNHSAESGRGGGGGGGGAGAGAVAGAGASAGAGAGGGTPVPTARREDPLYAAVLVGVVTALAILVGVAVFLVVHRHRHRKCFASPLTLSSAPAAVAAAHLRTTDTYSACGPGAVAAAGGFGGKGACEVKSDEYQEPYQPLRCAPYFSCSTVLLEMAHLRDYSATPLQAESGNYEYAVPEPEPEPSAAPLLDTRRRRRLHSRRSSSPTSGGSDSDSGSAEDEGEGEGEGAEAALRHRLETGSVPELPRHRLRMISKLAEGAFGTVYVAEADGVPEYEGGVSAEKRLVAVKFLSHEASHEERCAFERDVRILAALSHPCLARVVGACRGAGAPLAVVLEYLAGGDLCAHLGALAAPPAPAHLLHVALQLAAGMRYLEALNFVHRDLAARNCLVGPGYKIKIGDFGTDNEAYARDYCAVGGRLVPLRWAAPEAALEGRHSTRADVWSFGVTLHEVFSLCRRRPYERLSDEQVASALRGGGGCQPAERAPLCPRDVFELMRECWRREPRARPAFRDAHAFLQTRPPAPPS